VKYVIEVRRNRQSVTQGSATILINDKEVMTFGDTIELITTEKAAAGKTAHGEAIGSWASTIPDSEFILGLLNNYSDKVKEALRNDAENSPR